MKSTLSNKETKTIKRYPYIGIHTTGPVTDKDDLVILFTDEDTGIVIYREDGGDLGEYSTNWNEEHFRPYEYTVSLSN